MTNHEITEEIFEILNGLSIAWMLANVRDNAKRAELQAPIIAAQEAAQKLLKHFEAAVTEDTLDDFNYVGSRHHY